MTTCSHRATIKDVVPSAKGCEECLRIGSAWVHLRLCRSCGHVGCCDESPHRHATAHFRATGHPIIEGYDPPEGWGLVLRRRDRGRPARPDAPARSDPAIRLTSNIVTKDTTMSKSALSFRYQLEKTTPQTGAGGITRGASVREFPARSASPASPCGCTGSMRELHWHANAAEWAYVVSGTAARRCCTPAVARRPTASAPATSGISPAAGGTASRARPRRMPLHPDLRQWRLLRGHTFSVTDWRRAPRRGPRPKPGSGPQELAPLPRAKLISPGAGAGRLARCRPTPAPVTRPTATP